MTLLLHSSHLGRASNKSNSSTILSTRYTIQSVRAIFIETPMLHIFLGKEHQLGISRVSRTFFESTCKAILVKATEMRTMGSG